MNLKEKLLELVLVSNDAQKSKDLKSAQRKELQEALEEAGLDSIKTDEGPSCSLATKLGVSYDKACTTEAMQWLRENGHEDLIVTTISSDGLTSMIREATENGGEPDSGWPDFLKVSTFNTLRVMGKNYGK